MSETEALAFIRQALSEMRTDIRELSRRFDEFVNDTDSRMQAAESRCLTCVAQTASVISKPTTSGLFSNLSWVPTAWKFAWPLVVIFGIMWKSATPETKDDVKKVAYVAAGVSIPKPIKDSTKDALSAASIHANSRYWASRESTNVRSK